MERIKWPLLLSLGAGLLFLLAVSLSSSYISLQQNHQRDFRSRIASVDKLFRQSLDQERHTLTLLAQFWLHDATLQAAFLARERQVLYEAALPSFQWAKNNESLDAFTFINPDKSIFLRLHQPGHFADTLPAFPLATVNDRPAVFIETRGDGRLTVNLLQPWIVEGQRVGYLHLVKETDTLLPRLKEVLGVELAFLNRPTSGDQTDVPDSQAGRLRILNTTLPEREVELEAQILQYPEPLPEQLFETTLGRQKFLTGFFPVHDGRGRLLGNVAVLEDVSIESRARLGFSLVETAIALITGTLLFVFFWIFIGRIEQRLSKVHADLEHEVLERRRTQVSLAETNQIMEDIAQGITESILLLSKDFKILWANRHALEETGHQLGDIIGNYCYKITHHLDEPCQAPHDICPLHELLETGRPTREEHVHFDKDDNRIIVAVTAYPIRDENGAITKFVHVSKDISERKQAEEERERLVTELRLALSEVKALSGMLPICASCKKIRDDQGYWKQIESYIRDHSEVEFSHGICPDCFKQLYPEYCEDDTTDS